MATKQPPPDRGTSFGEKQALLRSAANDKNEVIRDTRAKAIVSYDGASMNKCSVFTTYSGTVFTNKFLWMQTAGLLLGAAGIAAAIVGFIDPEHVNMGALEGMTGYLSGLVGFVLGLFVSLAIGRWWEVRISCYGGWWGNTESVMMYLSAFFPGTSGTDQEVKELFLRYTLLSHAMIFSTQQGTNKDLRWAVDSKLATAKESKLLEKTAAQAVVPLMWCMSMIGEQCKTGRIPFPELVGGVLDTHILGAKGGIGGAFTFTGVQLPLAYVHIVALCTKLTFLLITLQVGVEWAVGFRENDLFLILANLLYIIVVPTVYQGLLDIQEQIRNPFGTDEADFPQYTYHDDIQASYSTYCKAGEELPKFY
jgi:hypothetical protein